MFLAWFSAFVLTQCVECPIYYRALSSGRRAWFRAFWISALTHPLFFLLLPFLFGSEVLRPLWMVEVLVVAMEFIILRWMGVKSALAWALCANGASLLVGGMTRSLWGWP